MAEYARIFDVIDAKMQTECPTNHPDTLHSHSNGVRTKRSIVPQNIDTTTMCRRKKKNVFHVWHCVRVYVHMEHSTILPFEFIRHLPETNKFCKYIIMLCFDLRSIYPSIHAYTEGCSALKKMCRLRRS